MHVDRAHSTMTRHVASVCEPGACSSALSLGGVAYEWYGQELLAVRPGHEEQVHGVYSRYLHEKYCDSKHSGLLTLSRPCERLVLDIALPK